MSADALCIINIEKLNLESIFKGVTKFRWFFLIFFSTQTSLIEVWRSRPSCFILIKCLLSFVRGGVITKKLKNSRGASTDLSMGDRSPHRGGTKRGGQVSDGGIITRLICSYLTKLTSVNIDIYYKYYETKTHFGMNYRMRIPPALPHSIWTRHNKITNVHFLFPTSSVSS